MSDGDGEKRTIERDCIECGKTIEITVYEDNTYEGGHYYERDKSTDDYELAYEDNTYEGDHYYGEFTVPDEDSDGEYEKTGEWEGHDVVKWTGDEESYEFWECDDCYCSPDQ